MKIRTDPRRMKPRAAKCPAHMARVRGLPCLVCGARATAHHVTGYADRRGRITRSDRRIVPLCLAHHQIQFGPYYSVEALNHQGFFRVHEIDLLAEAKRLEAESVAMGVLSDGP